MKTDRENKIAAHAGDEEPDRLLEQALCSFRASVHAWSESAESRTRGGVAHSPRRSGARLVANWALGFVLAVATVSGGLLERSHLQDQAKIRAAQEAEHQRQLEAQRAQEEEELLARVDSDVARQTPSAMEPLAALMVEDESR